MANGAKVVPFIKPEEKLPPITAEIRYTGTGRLKGRWEIVKPGENLPEREDLLSEAALPLEQRGLQKRYTLLSRFNVNLPPGGKYLLPGPENWRIDKTVEGMYLLLFRVEASDAADSVSNNGQITIATGGVAGFAMPTLRYYVGNSSNAEAIANAPDAGEATVVQQMTLSWTAVLGAVMYRIEIFDSQDELVFSAVVLPPLHNYQLPSFLRERVRSEALRRRVTTVHGAGQTIEASPLKELNNQ